MIGDKIIIRLHPTEVFQQLYVYKNNERMEKLGVTLGDFVPTLLELVKKYQVYSLDVSGNHAFAHTIMHEFVTSIPTDFVIGKLSIRYL